MKSLIYILLMLIFTVVATQLICNTVREVSQEEMRRVSKEYFWTGYNVCQSLYEQSDTDTINYKRED